MSKPVKIRGYLGYYAGFISRATALIVDGLVVAVSFVTLAWLLSVTASMWQIRPILGFTLQQFPMLLNWFEALFSPAGVTVWAFLYTAVYYIFFWSLTGQTLGKALLGLRVLTQSGRRLPFWRAILRFMGYLVGVSLLGIPFLIVVLDDRREALHDKIAGSHVLYTWDALPDERFLADRIRSLTGRHDRDGE